MNESATSASVDIQLQIAPFVILQSNINVTLSVMPGNNATGTYSSYRSFFKINDMDGTKCHILIHLPPDIEDFRLDRTKLVFVAGTNNGTIQTCQLVIGIVDDHLVEGNESFVISGRVTSPVMFLPGRNMTTITIVDNEGKCRLPLFSNSGKSIF